VYNLVFAYGAYLVDELDYPGRYVTITPENRANHEILHLTAA
jgi:hypothetical protein